MFGRRVLTKPGCSLECLGGVYKYDLTPGRDKSGKSC